MHSAITTFATPAVFDAGRQPLASIHLNTPKSKTKRPVKGKKAENVFLPQSTFTHTHIPTNCVDACDLSADEDIPLALLKKLRSASFVSGPPTLQRGMAIGRKAVQLDINSESPLTQLLLESAPPPASELVTLRQPRVEPKNPALQIIPIQSKKTTILYPVGPVRPMMCIVPDCLYDWHIHLNPSNL
ncbi:hypothetical protein JOM56_004490 [Amanita muscaria]